MMRTRRNLRRQVRDLAAMVDHIIDAWPPSTGPSVPVHGITGPVYGQELVISAWSCHDPGIGLSTDQAMTIRREHYMCPADDPAVCRIKPAALARLVATGKLVPAGRGAVRPAPILH
ncbi:hypothetical protein [Nocardia sp. NPDC051750]|uniref:hypothetical protein n=1 Tax=Nocardia sp. NPDC051750 TaxID=3364325 RepID=UPI00378B34B1